MIRIILVAMTVVLYLIFSVPVLTMLRLRAKRILWESRKKVSVRFRGCSVLY